MSKSARRAMMRSMTAGAAGEKAFLWTDAAGGRHASWHVPVLIWVTPAVFVLAALFLAAEAFVRTTMTVPTTGEVVRVYDWDGNYGPVFRYVWTDGTTTEATSGTSDPSWNFPIGSQHAIRYFPEMKRDIVIVGAHNWYVAGWIALIALPIVLLSSYAQSRVNRWLRGGAPAPG